MNGEAIVYAIVSVMLGIEILCLAFLFGAACYCACALVLAVTDSFKE